MNRRVTDQVTWGRSVSILIHVRSLHMSWGAQLLKGSWKEWGELHHEDGQGLLQRPQGLEEGMGRSLLCWDPWRQSHVAGFGLLSLPPSLGRPSPRVPSGTSWQQADSLAPVTAGRGAYTGAGCSPADGTQGPSRGWGGLHIPPPPPRPAPDPRRPCSPV